MTVGSSNSDWKNDAEALKVLALSAITNLGVENLAQNLLNILRTVAVDISRASSRRTAREQVHVKRHIYTVANSFVDLSRMRIAPV